MKEESIAKLAAELDRELSSRSPLSAADREALESLRRDLQRLLDEGPSEKEAHITVGRLRAATGRFEVTHPNLTAVMAEVINSLSTMGF